jgi:UDP-3-O-[3-hydroxymyristoyl] glucosamine N-acyltransferase
MVNQLRRPTKVSELAAILGLKWSGLDLNITHVQSIDLVDDGALCFIKTIEQADITKQAILIAPNGARLVNGAVLEANNPRLEFARALAFFDQTIGFQVLHDPPQLADNVKVSPTAILGKGVVIGARTYIGHHVIIGDGVRVGEDCVIKSNTVIGEAGFGFERDEFGAPVRILHLGTVIIGNRVELGSLNTVCRGTLKDTIIDDDVKTDDHVHIAHNCRVRKSSLITACVELSGGVDIGEYSWIGPNSSIIQKAKIGKNCFVGIGSNVTKSFEDGVSVAGNPAKQLIKKDKDSN